MRKILGLLWTFGVLAAANLQAQDQMIYSITNNNTVYTANADGTGSPTILVNPAVGGTLGPVGMFADFANNQLFIAGGNYHDIYIAPLGGGASTIIPNGNFGFEHFDVYADPANNRYFYSTDNANGVWVADLSGIGAATNPATSGDPVGSVHGLDYDPASDLLYAAQIRDARISSINVATGVATTLFDGADGVTGPRGLNIDPVNGKIYWTQFSSGFSGTGEIMVGNMDGTGTPIVLFTVPAPFFPHGVLIDWTTNTIYWAEFTGSNSKIMKGNSDGTGLAVLVRDLPGLGRLRGLEWGQPLAGNVPTMGQWSLIILGLSVATIVILAAGAKARKAKTA